MGAAFVTKRYINDGNGNIRPAIEGTMQYIVNPQDNHSTKVITGTFTLGQPVP